MDPEHVGFASTVDPVAHVFVTSLRDEIVLEGPDGHHLDRVRRVHEGERLTAADGAGAWRPYWVGGASGGVVRLRASGPVAIEPELTPSLGMAFALTKGDKPEFVVQKLTELGVDRIIPVMARRSVVRWDPTKAIAARQRLQRIAREAAGQCRRARLPVIEAVCELRDVVGHGGLVVADRAGVPPRDLGRPECGAWLGVVGPEGGFDDDEHAMLGAAIRVAVGPHVLRAETAAVAIAAVLTVARSQCQ